VEGELGLGDCGTYRDSDFMHRRMSRCARGPLREPGSLPVAGGVGPGRESLGGRDWELVDGGLAGGGPGGRDVGRDGWMEGGTRTRTRIDSEGGTYRTTTTTGGE
jgi:hypothetical protein